jgi:hypothetical protein
MWEWNGLDWQGKGRHGNVNNGGGCYKLWRKRREVKEIKPQGNTRFNVENPPNMRGKNHGRQPASNFTMIGVRLQTPTVVAYKKKNE